MQTRFQAAGWIVAAMLAVGQPARADQVQFGWSGSGINGFGSLTYEPDPISHDPAGASLVTGISGTFSDASPTLVGGPIVNATITGLVATLPTPKTPRPDGFVFPTSLSYIPASNLPTIDGGVLSFDNLFYLLGAPDTCDDGITGGYLDVFGLMFALSNGDTVDVWSDGGGPNNSAIYGVAVLQGDAAAGYTAIDYTDPNNTGVNTMNVSEPASIWLLVSGLLGCMVLRRRDRSAGWVARCLS